ncbi:hypothetical protein D3C86_910990 [compost metagenome]
MRTAFMFISFISSTSSMLFFLLKVLPDAGRKECLFTPLNLILTPFTKTPSRGFTTMVLKPIFLDKV